MQRIVKSYSARQFRNSKILYKLKKSKDPICRQIFLFKMNVFYVIYIICCSFILLNNVIIQTILNILKLDSKFILRFFLILKKLLLKQIGSHSNSKPSK